MKNSLVIFDYRPSVIKVIISGALLVGGLVPLLIILVTFEKVWSLFLIISYILVIQKINRIMIFRKVGIISYDLEGIYLTFGDGKNLSYKYSDIKYISLPIPYRVHVLKYLPVIGGIIKYIMMRHSKEFTLLPYEKIIINDSRNGYYLFVRNTKELKMLYVMNNTIQRYLAAPDWSKDIKQ